MELDIYTREGTSTGRKASLSDDIFGAEVKEHAVYLAIKAQRENSRQGTRATKTRSMVSGGGRKPWKQKGRGTARAGTTRSPIWRSGGITHGPQPVDYNSQLPKKVKKLARISVLSAKAKDEQIKVLEDFTLDEVKTKHVASVIKNLGVDSNKTLVLLPGYDSNMLQASRNIKNLKIAMADNASTYDLLDCKTLVIFESAIEKLEGTLRS